ncbi:iron hydrogenase [Cristinia sonorae]|uniref:Cytosolic Fe-S cluster assembly factor NAR1 n=1 Tax=Cristinia sonorae TaxID=1940300 RepID=A0A8K0V056_9AGAR|nr:iron hydrogenase [Cristinia sonorae]
MAFSGALTLTDLNDFITPSQACIKPVEQTNLPEVADPGAASTEIKVDSAGGYYEVAAPGVKSVREPQKKLETAQISLNDCLACSGCITSAESVLITLQSHTEVLNFLSQNPPRSDPSHKIPVISIAPQTLASLAATISSTSSFAPISLERILRRVEAFCKSVLGFEHVFDTTFARHVSLLEHAQEFRERKGGKGSLPMLASACPGWVCYAEKTHAEMLPFISRTKSPQQVMGTLVKEWLGKRWNKTPDQIYHVSVMPCYDKKLEASRSDFYNDAYSTREVDCVITTGELDLLMKEKGWDLSIPVDGEHDTRTAPPHVHPSEQLPIVGDNGTHAQPETPQSFTIIPELITHPGTSSGSYLHSLISLIRSEAENPLELSVRAVRSSSDYEEYTLTEPGTGTVVFRGAKCYGFRNLQNVVRKVGRDAGVQVGKGAAGRLAAVRGRRKIAGAGGSEASSGAEKGYDYVEVMACPGGCVNGGGQLKPPAKSSGPSGVDEEGFKRDWESNGVSLDGEEGGWIQRQGAKWGDKEWTRTVEEMYWHGLTGLPTPPPSPRTGSDERRNSVEDKKAALADRLATLVLRETCQPQVQDKLSHWTSTMDDDAEARRRTLFRTQYRAVESEVVGLAVKW